MIRLTLVALALVLFAADASACGGRLGAFRSRVRERIVHRERHIVRGGCATPGVFAIPLAGCMNGKCAVPAKK